MDNGRERYRIRYEIAKAFKKTVELQNQLQAIYPNEFFFSAYVKNSPQEAELNPLYTEYFVFFYTCELVTLNSFI